MRTSAFWTVCLGSLSYVGCTAAPPAETADPLEGVWELTSAETVAPDGSATPYQTQESFLLFTDEHYSMNWSSGPEPTPSYETRFRPTRDEALARYGSLLINAGRYTTSGDTLRIDPEFALVPEYVGGSGTFEYEVSGDTLILEWVEIFANDGSPDPMTSQGFSFRYRFVRGR